MNRASPRVPVAYFAKTGLSAAEAAPAAADASTWANWWTQYVKGGGIVAPADILGAALPDWQMYQRGRVSFSPLNPTGADTGTTATLSLYGKLTNDDIVLIGESAVTDILNPPPIEFDNEPGMVYALAVTKLSLSGATAIDLAAFVQGYNVNVYVQAG